MLFGLSDLLVAVAAQEKLPSKSYLIAMYPGATTSHCVPHKEL